MVFSAAMFGLALYTSYPAAFQYIAIGYVDFFIQLQLSS